MASIETILGADNGAPVADKLSQAYPKINRNFAELNAELTAEEAARLAADTEHATSTAAHAAEHITYSGEVMAADNVAEAIDTLKEVVDAAIVNGDSSPQASAAAVSVSGTTYPTLKGRLDAEYSGTVAQLAETAADISALSNSKADITEVNTLATAKANQVDLDATNAAVALRAERAYVDTQIAAVVSGSPKGTYATLTALQTSFPTGNTNIYLVTADGNWYYWNGSAWTVGGTYQSTGIADKTVSYGKTDFLTTGKNLYNPATDTSGYYVDYNNGSLVVNAGNKVTDYIPLQPNTTYTLSSQISGDLSQLAFFNSAKTYVSGLPNTGTQKSITFTTAANVYYMRLSIPTAVTDGIQLETGSAMTTFESYRYISQKLYASNLKDGIVKDQHVDPASNVVVKKLGKNLLDISKVTAGNYVNYVNGNLVANVDNKVTDYIVLLPNTAYTLSSQVSGDLSQLAFYDSSKVFVSGLANSGTQQSVTFTTGSSVYFMRLSIPATVTTGVQLELGSLMTVYESYRVSISMSDLPPSLQTTNVINVRPDGTGNFTSLRAAVNSITDASSAKPYTIQIYEGTYDILSYYTSTEINDPSFIGLIKPDYVDFVGIGDKKKVILKCEFPSDDTTYNATTKGRVSTVCWYGNGKMENLTVTGMNLRYAVHDDYNFPNAKKTIKKCIFIHYKGNGTNYGGKQAWGEGSWSGMDYLFEDCEFRSEWDYYAYTSHNNTGFTAPTNHKFVNCKFFTTMGESLRFESLGSGQKDTVTLIGCKLNGTIAFTPYSGNAAGNIDYELKGYGNEIVPVRFANTDGVQYTYEFVGQTREMYNGGATPITRGMPVMLNSDGTSIVPFVGSGKIRYFGIAMQDIPINTNGIVRVGGYLPIANTSLTGLVVGDTIGIVGGALVKAVTSDYIGVVTLTDYILLG